MVNTNKQWISLQHYQAECAIDYIRKGEPYYAVCVIERMLQKAKNPQQSLEMEAYILMSKWNFTKAAMILTAIMQANEAIERMKA